MWQMDICHNHWRFESKAEKVHMSKGAYQLCLVKPDKIPLNYCENLVENDSKMFDPSYTVWKEILLYNKKPLPFPVWQNGS